MSQCMKYFRDRLFHGHGKSRNTEQRSNKAKVQPDLTPAAPVSVSSSQLSKKITQLKDSFLPQDLWQSAFDQLDPKEKDNLSQTRVSASLTNPDKENLSQTTAIIDEVIKITEKRYKEYQQGGLKIKRSTGEDVDLRKLSQKIIDAALSFKDIISTTANFDPTNHAASAWAVVSLGLTMTKNRFDLHDALFGSSEYLTNILARCAFVEKNFYRTDSSERTEIGRAIVRVYKEILQYAAEVLVSQKPSVGRWILDSVAAITKQRLTELQSSIKEDEQYLHHWVELYQHLQHEKAAEIILAQTNKVSANLDTLTQQFNLPIAEGAFYDSYMNQHEAVCLEKTRTELCCKISKWAKSFDSKCIFWLNGMAGTGKSTIARTVAKFFESDGQLGASFFFKKGEADRGHARRFIPTITKQLMKHNQHLASGILQAIGKDSDISAKSLREQFDKLILRPLQDLESNQTSTMVIVIDALDECEQEFEIRTILELLPQVQYSTSIRLKVFLTSRPELPIQLGFKKIDNYQDLVLHELPQTVIEHDIRLYLKDELSKIKDDDDTLPSDWPGSDRMEKLVRMSIPLFIFAATVCRFIGDGIQDPEERIGYILQSQGVSQSAQMENIYQPVLEQLLNPRDGNESRRLENEFCDIVGVIILLTTPLSVHSLGKLLNLPERNISFLLRKLHSVLSVPKSIHLPVCFLHLSFRDYLLNTKSAFHVDEEETHRKIALHCLRIMNVSLKHNICSLLRYGTQRMDIQRQIIDQHLSAELQYSCRYWVYHLEQSKAQVWKMEEVLTLLKKHFLHWLEALSLMGIIQETVGMINTLQSGIGDNAGSEISEFLYDAKRFVLKNIHIIDTAPYQLYCSTLIFSPKESIIRKTFHGEQSRRIHILPEVESSWSAEIQTLEGHSDWVQSVAFSPDGQIIASGSGENTIKLWDARTGKEQQTLEGHSDWVQSVAFSPDGQTVASGSSDNTIKLWDVRTGKEQQTLKGHFHPVQSVAFSPDGQMIASGSYDNTIKLWDWDSKMGKEQQTLEGHSDWVQSVAFSPDGQTVASGSSDNTIKLWDVRTGKEQQTLEGHFDWIQSVAFSPDGQMIASGSYDNTIKLWDWDSKTGKEQQTLEGHYDWVQSVAFSPDGQTVASGSSDNTIKLWDSRTGKEQQTLEGHFRPIQSVTFSPCSQMVASGSGQNTIKLWDVRTGKEQQTLEGHSDSVWSMTFSPDSQTVASGSSDNTIKLWDARTGKEQQTLEGHSDSVWSIAFSPDSQTVASGSSDNTIKLWDARKGKEQQTLEGHSHPVQSVAFSPDGQTVASGSSDNTIKLWDVRTGKEQQTLEGHSDLARSVAFSPDGQMVASGSSDNTIKLWDARTGKEQQTLDGHSHPVQSVAFSLDGQMIASGSYDNTIKLWDVRTGKEQQTLEGHFDWVKSVAFSPDGQMVVSASSDNTIKLWDARTGKEQQTLDGHSHPVQSVALSPDGQKVAPQVSLANEWVAFGREKVLWLPSEYRSFSCSATQDGILALGYGNGRVFIVGF